MNAHDEKPDLRTHLTDFFARFRIPLIVIAATIVVGLVVFFVGSEIRDSRLQTALEMAESVQREYDEWVNASAESDDGDSSAESILTSVEEILDRFPRSYAAQRALFIRGSLHFEREEWSDAAGSFIAVADQFGGSHLAPVALSNAAAAYEEEDDGDAAVALWIRIVNEFGVEAPEAARALFSLGRIAEGSGSYAEAAIRYNRLLDDFPSSSWTNLARNRIIYLTTEGLIGG